MTAGTLPHIAFIGRAGAGKTTAAELLVKHFGYERLSFAAPLKVMAGTSTDRGVLQNLGTGVRALCEDAWVNLLVADLYQRERALANRDACEGTYVVDDCRFPNEAFKLKVEGFVIVRVGAPHYQRVARLRGNGKLQDESQLEHISETALDGYSEDYTVYNTGVVTDLLDDITTILNREQQR